MESNDILYAGSNFNKEAVRKYERAQFVEHLRSQFMPDIPFGEIDKREEAAGELWDLCQSLKEKEDANSKESSNKVAGDVVEPKRNNRRNN